MNKLSDLTILKQLLKEKQNKLSTLKYEYEAIVEQEPYMRNRLKNRQYSIHKLAGEIKSIEKEIKTMESKHLQDSMGILRLSGFTTDSDCGEKVYTKGAEDQCKDGGEGSGIKGHKTSYEKFAEESDFDVMSPEEFKKLTGLTPKEYENKYPSKKKNEDSCGEKVFTKGMEDGGPGSGIKGHTTNDPDIQYREFMKGKKKPLTYSEGKKLLEEAKNAGIHSDYLRGMERGLANLKDDDATEMGTFEQLGQNHETEAMEPEKNPVQAQDDEVGEKFKTVMKEFGKGELKSSSGETVTDPEQAKAIAYSEQREAKDSDPKVAEAKKLIDLFGGAM